PCKLYGIEKRCRSVHIARRALGREATILHGDLRVTSLPRSDALLMFDVMHLIPWADQDDLLVQMKDAIAPGGWLVLRDANASEGGVSALSTCGTGSCKRCTDAGCPGSSSEPQTTGANVSSDSGSRCTPSR